MKELKSDIEEWARAREECQQNGDRLCTLIQADGDTKKQAIDARVAVLQQQTRLATADRLAAINAILKKREERQEQVAIAAVSPDISVKGSSSASLVASVLSRTKAAVPPASAAEFCAQAAPAEVVGQVVVATALVDPEVTALAAAKAAADAPDLSGSALLQRVANKSKVQQFATLMYATRLAGKRYRKLYTWSTDGRSNASFHQRCDNQVGGIGRGLRLCCVTL